MKHILMAKRIGDAILTPGWTSYSNRIQYQAYDVMEMLLTGENRIGVMLADGIGILDKIENRKVDYGERTSFISELIISYEDGRKESIIDEKNSSYNYGLILSSSIYNGERVDMNLKKFKMVIPWT